MKGFANRTQEMCIFQKIVLGHLEQRILLIEGNFSITAGACPV
jgi:hypothetical protein